MVTKGEAGSLCNFGTSQKEASVEDHVKVLNVLCRLLDTAANEFDLADQAGDLQGTVDALSRLRAISAEIDHLMPGQLIDGVDP